MTIAQLERKWAMPNKNTFEIKPIKELVEKELTDGLWIDPFANNKKYATVTNDLNPIYDTNYHLDALEFLRMFEDKSVNGVLFDPPYSPRQIKELYESVGLDTQGGVLTRSNYWSKMKEGIARIVIPKGKVISFGWNSQGIGKNRGFVITNILLVAHGGHHNDTICTVEKKLESEVESNESQ